MSVGVFLLIFLMGTCLIAKSQPFKTEKEFKTYLLENNETLDPIEGIWEFKKNTKRGFRDNGKAYKNQQFPSYNFDIVPYKVAIYKISENNFFCYDIDIVIGLSEIKGCGDYWFKTTAIDGQYIYDVGGSCEFSFHDKAIINSNGDLIFNGKFEEYKDDIFSWYNFSVIATKLSLTQAEIRNYKKITAPKIEATKPIFSFGTGCAVTNDLIMTCYHVVKDAKQISIRGIDGNFDKTYTAHLSFYDDNLDVAYLKLDDRSISNNIVLPYSFKSTKSQVGENIFVLGYPLQNTMGQEIKLTTGVISSNSGFLGDTTIFQISAPVQAGNSGGPLFDNSGNLIGIVTAKHLKADNVGYALKLILQKDFLKKNGVQFTTTKKIAMDLSKKVILYKKFIYSIEVSLE